MQTTHTTVKTTANGAFHARTLSVRCRPGMQGAYVRHQMESANFDLLSSVDTGWVYHNNYLVLARWSKKYGKDLFTLLYPADCRET